MAYTIERLTQANGFTPMQPVEHVGSRTQKRLAIRDARALAQRFPGHWLQVKSGAAVVATYTCSGRGVRKV